MSQKNALFFLIIIGALLSGCATQTKYWKASAIAQSPTPMVRLTTTDGGTVGLVEKARIQKLIEIKGNIEKVAGTAPAEFWITAGDSPNALSAPTKQGLIVAVNIPLINLFGSDWDAYAAILGHEYAHLTLNHSGIRQQREQARQGISGILGTALNVAGIPFGSSIVDVASTAVTTVYSRDEERDADRVGLSYSRQAGYDPHGAIRAWHLMMSASTGVNIPFLSTHPTSEERLETMKKLAGE